jgi:hypothetical protein
MIINLTTPMSDDKERQRRNEVILAAIERHTEKHMNDDHTATSQPTQSDALLEGDAQTILYLLGVRHGREDERAKIAAETRQPTQSDVNERLGAWLSAALDDPNCSDAFKQDINDWFANQPTQSDALQAENERLREHLISALDTLKDAEICDDNCGPCNEARAALEQSK